jgi:dTDP-4-amino-4,6-dideoxygalactose transaminase
MSAAPSHSVPFFNFPLLYRQHREKFLEIFDDVCSRGGFILQRDVDEFETKLAKLVGVRFAVGVSDCTNAMLLGLRAMGIGAGAEVILPSHTFIATAQAIHYAGAVPVPVDIGPDGLIDPAAVERAITPRTRAIMVVQLNGRICDMDALHAVAKRHGLPIVEDSAQALGATYKGKGAGSFGTFGAFSFYPSKLLGGFGDGGALTTDDEAVATEVRRMRNHGANQQKVIEAWGTNSRLDNVHAAILNYKIGLFPAEIERRRAIAGAYHAAFSSIPGLRLPPPPGSEPERFDCFQNYELETDRRDALKQYLADNGVGTLIQWGGMPVHQMRFLGFTQDLPATDAFFRRCIMLPMHHMLTDADVAHVIAQVTAFFAKTDPATLSAA